MFPEIIISGVIMNLIGFLGIIGNTISVIVLSRPKMKSSINFLLVLLGFCDMFTILSHICLIGIPYFYEYSGYEMPYTYMFKVYPFLVQIMYPFSFITHTISVYLTVTVTAERFVAVCHPLKARSLCTRSRVKSTAALVIVFSTLYNMPRFWESTLQEEYSDADNDTIYLILLSDFAYYSAFYKVYAVWLCLVFLYILPLTCLLVLNWKIYGQMQQANLDRHQLTCQQKTEIRLAAMLLCDNVVFTLCNVLTTVQFILQGLFDIYDVTVGTVCNILNVLNCSINILIYTSFNNMFKQQLIQMVCSSWICHVRWLGGQKTVAGPNDITSSTQLRQSNVV